MTLLEKINNLTWYDLINKLKDILKGLNDKPAVDSRPYKVYTALLTQTGTDAPVATVLENTLGDIVWSRDAEGKYRATSTNLYTESKTLILHGVTDSFNSEQGIIPFVIQKDSSDSSIIRVNTLSITSDIEQDGFLYQTPIEIRVYN